MIPVVIEPSDKVITVCHEGWNRSQTLLQSIQSIKRCFTGKSDTDAFIVPFFVLP